MQQWYMAIGGHQVGPVSQDEILSNLRNGSIDADTLVFTAGMATWQKLRGSTPPSRPSRHIGHASPRRGSAAGAGRRARHRLRHSRQRDAVRRGGTGSGEAAVAEAGAFVYRRRASRWNIFGDGSQAPRGVLDALLGAGKRLLTGKGLFMTVFQNQGRASTAWRSPRRIPARSWRWI
ncbi:MAG: GYF domain-containing protein [Vicinamibacterales bacterium]